MTDLTGRREITVSCDTSPRFSSLSASAALQFALSLLELFSGEQIPHLPQEGAMRRKYYFIFLNFGFLLFLLLRYSLCNSLQKYFFVLLCLLSIYGFLYTEQWVRKMWLMVTRDTHTTVLSLLSLMRLNEVTLSLSLSSFSSSCSLPRFFVTLEKIAHKWHSVWHLYRWRCKVI